MKVLFIISDSTAHGGTEILAFNLMNQLKEQGIECYLLSRFIYEGDDDSVLSLKEMEHKRYWSLHRNLFNKLVGYKRSDEYLKEVIRRIATSLNVDWIINHTYDLCAAIPTNEGWKTAQVFHWSIKGYENNVLADIIIKKRGLSRFLSFLSFKHKQKRWHKALTNFTRHISLTNAARPEILEVCAFKDKTKLITIPNPIMHSTPSRCISSLSNNNVVFVGRLSKEKGVIRLLRIWEMVSKTLIDTTLSIYGDGTARLDMEHFIQTHHLERVFLFGFSHNIESIYTNADLCLMTSETEGFGMVLIEAMYYGVPCISFDCPVSPKEILADAGIIVPCYDERAFADNVIALIHDTRQLKLLQGKSIQRAMDFYTDKIICKWKHMLFSHTNL